MTELQREDDVHGSCALYLLGALDETAEAAFERHLATCEACMQQCEDFGPAATGLSLLTLEEVQPRVQEPPVAAPVVPENPAPAKRTSSRRTLIAALVAAAAVAAGATAFGVRELVTAPGPVSPVSASARAEGVGATARLTVTMAAKDRVTTVVASIVGIEPGLKYRLYATTTAGQTLLVAEWTGTTGAQEVAGEAAAPLADLAFFSVTKDDGTSVVLARVER
jgi:anti-sigma factor RsiW